MPMNSGQRWSIIWLFDQKIYFYYLTKQYILIIWPNNININIVINSICRCCHSCLVWWNFDMSLLGIHKIAFLNWALSLLFNQLIITRYVCGIDESPKVFFCKEEWGPLFNANTWLQTEQTRAWLFANINFPPLCLAFVYLTPRLCLA